MIQSLRHVSEDLAKDLYEVSLEFLNSNTIEADGESEDEGDFGLKRMDQNVVVTIQLGLKRVVRVVFPLTVMIIRLKRISLRVN